MVTLGFIVEGKTERMIVESEKFQNILNKIGLLSISEAVDIKGRENFSTQVLDDQIAILKNAGANTIIVLTDKENAPCFTSVKEVIKSKNQLTIIIAVKTIEAWFLADTSSISEFMGSNLKCDNPEAIDDPFNFIKEEKMRLAGRGVRSKKLLCSRMLRSGFSIENAATHPNCPSAKYFLDKLKSLAHTN